MGCKSPSPGAFISLVLLLTITIWADASGAASIQDLIRAGTVTVRGQGMGADSGDNLVLSIRNNAGSPVEVQVPAGTILRPAQSHYAALVVRRVRGVMVDSDSFEEIEKVQLAPGVSMRLLVESFSMRFGRTTPAQSTVLQVDGRDPLLGMLLEKSLSKTYSLKIVQAIVWLRSGGFTDAQLEKKLGIDSLSVMEARDFFMSVEGEFHAKGK